MGSRSYNLIDIDTEEIPPEIPPETPTATMTYADGALTISDLEGSAKLIHASYSGGALSKVEITDAENGTQQIGTRNGDKFMLWSTVGEMLPLCEPVTVETGTIDTVVVYFSATNTTEGVAQKIADYTGADMFELQPVDPYTSDDLNWSNQSSRVVTEYNDENRHVELETINVPNWDSYNTVYIGAPIWWREFSWVIDDFVENTDFTGKTVVPFCTSSSTPLGDSATHLAAKSSSGTWLDGMHFGSGATDEQVRERIDGLNLN